MKHFFMMLSFLVSMSLLSTSKHRVSLPTNGCTLITCTKNPVVAEQPAEKQAAGGKDYYLPLEPVSHFILMQ